MQKSNDRYMNLVKNHLSGFVVTVWLLAGALFSACNKVDDHFNEVASQPWVTTGEIFLGDNGSFPYDYPKNVLVGDTMSLSGKMFISQGGYVQVGNAKAVLASDKQSIGPDGSTVDLIRFVITSGMGVGNNRPVTVTANGITISLPSINIRQFAGTPERTDTTLVVEQVAAFQPVNMGDYMAGAFNLLDGASVSGDGTLWFDNPLGVFKISNGQVQNVITPGLVLKDNNGSFTVNYIIGSVISYDGNTINFSVAVQDGPDTVDNYVFRLCQMDVNTQGVVTLNRTLMKKGVAARDGTPGAFEGAAGQLKMVAANLKTDANNNLYFTNCYCVETPNIDAGQMYHSIISNGINGLNGWPYALNNICKLSSNGSLSSLFSINPLYDNPIYHVPGFPLRVTSDFKIAPDGSVAYVYDDEDNFNDLSLLEYDLQKGIPLVSTSLTPPNYKFISYDSDPAAAYPNSPFQLYAGFEYANGDYSLQPLANGTILCGVGASIAAVDMLNQFAYCYAGTEIGLAGAPPSYQNELTGRAKDVSFNGNNAAAMVFCGVDRSGAVYYMCPGNSYQLTAAPLTFYKIYPKK